MACVLLQLTRGDCRVWALMPQVFERLARFCRAYDTETTPEDVVELVRAWFMTGDPRLGLWIAEEGGRVIGHLFATLEPMGANRPEQYKYCLIRQAEVDRGCDARQQAKEVFEQVKAWTVAVGLSRIVMATHRSEASMMRRWGFRGFKILMQLNLNGKADG